MLASYARGESEEAFAELVRRHLPLVYSAAMRQVRSPQLAEEVAQSVFLDLARNASRLKPGTVLAAWLHQVTRRTAIDVVRTESRRQVRENAMHQMSEMENGAADWSQIESLLDEGLDGLAEVERTALLLRYFEDKSLREVGLTLGTSEDAAQKRVSRGVDRLRDFFTRRGVKVGTTGLAFMLSTRAVEAIPAGLASSISASAMVTGLAAKSAGSVFVAKTITSMTALQKTTIAAGMLIAAGAGIYEASRAERLANDLTVLREQQSPISEQLLSAKQARDHATNLLATLRTENEQLRRDLSELPRLRGEVSRLRQETKTRADGNVLQANDPALSEAVFWKGRVAKLMERLKQTPSAGIPELQFLTEQDWLNAAREDLVTDQDYRRALSSLRHAGENKFVADLQSVLKQYIDANQGQFPTAMPQLRPYFKETVEDALLERYEIIPAAQMPSLVMGGDWIITQKTAIDPEFDARWGIGPNGYGTSGSSSASDAWSGRDLALSAAIKELSPALEAYRADHEGKEPSDPAQIQPYLSPPAQIAAMQTLLQQAKPKTKLPETP